MNGLGRPKPAQAGQGIEHELAELRLVWDQSAWDDYVWWRAHDSTDRKILKRINTLIRDVERNGNEGIGKPEPLKHGFHGYWSRRITDEHRLVYKLSENEVRIAACRYHYAG
jgi:toxin YoeB